MIFLFAIVAIDQYQPQKKSSYAYQYSYENSNTPTVNICGGNINKSKGHIDIENMYLFQVNDYEVFEIK